MKILIINPIFALSLWDFSLCKDITDKGFPNPPLALPTLAALVPKGIEVELCDENVESINFDSDADIIAITGFLIQSTRVFEIADKFRAQGKTVVIGGPVVEQSILDECQQHADTIFIGEAEYTWPQFIQDYQAGIAQGVYKQSKRINMHDSPLPRFELLKKGAYSTAIIETSRGCPYSCDFCEIPMRLGKKSRTKSVEQVMAEVEKYYQLGFDSIFFIDDHFVGNKRHTKMLLKELAKFVKRVNYRVSFSVQFTINFSKEDEMLELFYQANFQRVFIGLETSRESSLKSAHKNQNMNIDLIEAVQRIQSYNIIVWAGFIVGFDGDDATVFDEQYEFIQAAGVTIGMIGLLQAIPGTALYQRLEGQNRIKRDTTSGVRGPYQELIYSNVIPTDLTPAQLAKGYQSLVSQVYQDKAFSVRLMRLIKSSQRKIHPHDKITGEYEKQVFKRLLKYYLNLKYPSRAWLFIKTVTYTLLFKPSLFEIVITQLVAFKHFREFYHKVATQPVTEESKKSSNQAQVDSALRIPVVNQALDD